MGKKLRLLLIEDSDDDAALVLRELKRAQFELDARRVQNEPELLAALADGEWDIILSDYSLPQFSAPVAVQIIRSKGIEIPVIIISGTIGEDVAVEAIKIGAQDYIMKNNMVRLGSAVSRAMDEYAQHRKHREADLNLKMIEQQLLQLQKMDALGNLAGGVAHDFNNLLSVIIGYGERILARMPTDDPSRKDLETVVSTGERGAALTRQLLAISRRQPMTVQPLDLNGIVFGMENMLRRIIGENIRMTTRLLPDIHAVNADRSQMEQVVLNLVVNARDAMPKGGQILIETANVELDEEYARTHAEVKTGKYVMLAVSDTGVGIEPAILSRIFEPFFTTKSTGTGLGLSTVFGIVKQNNGHVWVYSELDKGTSFKIYLPRTQGAAAPRTTHSGPTIIAAGAGETVLLVEDEQPVRDLIKDVLSDAKYNVIEANDPEHALEILRTHAQEIHVLATDVMMPKMSGPDLALAALKVRPKIRILFLSGYTANHLTINGDLKEHYDFLEKPFTPKSLTRKLREVLSQR